jgi:hypothetical protein
MGRLVNGEEVRSLAEIKNRVSPEIQSAIKVVARYVRDTTWEKRKMLLSGYNMYATENKTYSGELMGVVKAFIPPVWDPVVC